MNKVLKHRDPGKVRNSSDHWNNPALDSLLLYPGIFQGHGSVKNQFFGSGIGIHVEITNALELEMVQGTGIFQGRLHESGDYFQGIRIQQIHKIGRASCRERV